MTLSDLGICFKKEEEEEKQIVMMYQMLNMVHGISVYLFCKCLKFSTTTKK